MNPTSSIAPVAILDYGLGNVFSILRACEHTGIPARLTQSKSDILSASAVILPGVGAFGHAMETLKRLDLVSVLRDVAASGLPLIGICLGMQLLMDESFEFGKHQGLGIIAGDVVRLPDPKGAGASKVPQVGWNRLYSPSWKPGQTETSFPETSFLSKTREGDHMYFVHSYYTRPSDASLVQSKTIYGDTTFCSTVQKNNVIGCQYHPERSGPAGLQLYKNLAARLRVDVKTPS